MPRIQQIVQSVLQALTQFWEDHGERITSVVQTLVGFVVNLWDTQFRTVLNIVPDRAEFTFEIRAVPGDDSDAILARFVAHVEGAILPELRAVYPASEMRLSVRAAAPPLGLAEAHPLVLLAQRASGRNAAGFVSYGTEAGYYQRAGIPAIVCGPGDIAQAHQPEEFITTTQLLACCDFLSRLIERQARRAA